MNQIKGTFLVGPLFAFSAGVALGHGCGTVAPAFLLFLSIFFSVISWGQREWNNISITKRWMLLVFVSVLFCLIGFARERIHTNTFHLQNGQLFELASKRNISPILIGQIIRAPEAVEGGSRVVIGLLGGISSVKNKPISGKLRLTIKGLHYSIFKPGDLIRFKASLRKVRNFKTPGAWDYELYMALRGIGVTGYIDSLAKVERVGHVVSSPYISYLRYWLEKLRHNIAQTIDGAFSADTKGIAIALVTGQRGFLGEKAKELFIKAGLGHILAVSGLHMGLLAAGTGGILYLILLHFKWLAVRIRVKKAAVVASAVICLIYAGLAGFSPSAIRAAAMYMAFAAAFYADKPFQPIHALVLSAWGLLLYNPFYLFSISFQLSYISTFFILLLIYTLKEVQLSHNKLINNLFWLVLITVVAYAATSPLGMYHFQRLSFAGPFLNVLFVPIVSFFVLPSLLVGAALCTISLDLAQFFWKLTDVFMEWILMSLSTLPLDRFTFWYPRPWQWQVALCYTLLLAMFFTSYTSKGPGWKRLRPFFATCILFLLFFVTIPYFRNYALKRQNHLELHVLDVGQGTCQVLTAPGGRVMVVDAGGLRSSLDVGKAVVGPFLRSLGITGIDILALSHPEQDHMGGMSSLLDQFKVREFWTNSDCITAEHCLELVNKGRKLGVKHVLWQDPAHRKLGEVDIHILPPQCKNISFKDHNNNSLVFHINFGKVDMLLPGDIQHKREKCLVEKGLGNMKVLVVPHHGSRTSSSSSFLKATHPEVAIVPVGYNNFLGLPNSDVLRSYNLIKAKVFRTDLDGTVTIRTNGRDVTTSTFCTTSPSEETGSLFRGGEPWAGFDEGSSRYKVWQHSPSK